MSMAARVDAALERPEALEALYRAAVGTGEGEEFAAEIVRRHAMSPDDVLIAAWHHRLQPGVAGVEQGTAATPADVPLPSPARGIRRAQWGLALALSAVLSLYYVLLGPEVGSRGRLAYSGAPAAACVLLVFLRVGRSETLARTGTSALPALRGRPLIAIAVLAVLTMAAIGRSGRLEHPTDVDVLILIHLPALAWLVLGWAVLGHDAAPGEVFAAVHKSVEALITAGLFAAAGGALTLMTAELFRAIGIELPNWIFRWVAYGGPGLIPVLAVATVYDPDRTPSGQRSEHGLARIIFTTGRLFLPLTLVVLAIYVVSIPWHFMQPFQDRGVLITYNVMLFAVVGLMVAATPLRGVEVREEAARWLRAGLVAVATLTLLVGVYAMAAVLHRTSQGGLTVNRLTVIGWNAVNIATLGLLLYRQARDGRAWIEASHRAFRIGLMGYAAWTLFVVIGVPLIWRGPR